MKILLSPQVRENDKIWYEIEKDVIKASINGISDTFDFTDMPDGELQLRDDEGNNLIETELDEVPILGAERTDGVLSVEILFSVDSKEQDERLLFPKPMTLNEFNDLMAELEERKELEEELDSGLEEEDSDDSLEETDDLVEPDEVVDDDIIDGSELVYKNDYIIDLEEDDF